VRRRKRVTGYPVSSHILKNVNMFTKRKRGIETTEEDKRETLRAALMNCASTLRLVEDMIKDGSILIVHPINKEWVSSHVAISIEESRIALQK
jgi:hypothetical protein